MKKTGKNRQRAVEGSSTVQQWLTWPWVFSLWRALVLEVKTLRAQEAARVKTELGKCSKLCATDSLLKVTHVHLSWWLYLWNKVLIADVSETTKQAQSGGLTLLTVTVSTFSLETVQIKAICLRNLSRWPDSCDAELLCLFCTYRYLAPFCTRLKLQRCKSQWLPKCLVSITVLAALQVAMTPKVSCFHNCLSTAVILSRAVYQRAS
jgi:hypothetical protein